MSEAATLGRCKRLAWRRGHRRKGRRGVTIVVVLGLISITMALSYAMLRAQGTAIQIQKNSHRLGNARQAAVSGLMAALAKMHRSEWEGVDSTLTGDLSSRDRFAVTFTAGDPALTAEHPDYADWPYRVTLLSTGYSSGEQDSGSISTHQVRAVVRLTPRQLSATPADWPAMQNYTVYQWTEGDFDVDIPCRIEGPVWMQGKLSLCPSYPVDNSAESRYLSDLNAMRLNGRPDYRPFNAGISWRSHNSGSTVTLVKDRLGLPTTTIASKTASGWNAPGTISTYQLYAGGPIYDVTQLGAELEGSTLRPDPKLNPLGVFYRDGSVELKDEVTIEGILIATSDLSISGRNVQLKAVELPALAGSNQPVRLQSVWTGDDFRVQSSASGTLQGMASVRDKFEVESGSEDKAFSVVGRLVTKDFAVRARSEWDYSRHTWADLYALFIWQLGAHHSVRRDYFPEYMEYFGRHPQPKITFKPDPQTPARRDQWTDLSQPIFVPASGDAGLRWDLIDWTDSPQTAGNS